MLTSHGNKVVPFGSEILLHPELLRVYQELGHHHIRSNGIVPANDNRALETAADCGIETVIYSINPLPETDILNLVPKEIVDRAIERVHASNLTPMGSLVVHAENMKYLDQVVQYAREKGLKSLEFLRLVPYRSNLVQHAMPETHMDEFWDQINRFKDLIPREELYLTVHRTFGITRRKSFPELLKKQEFCPAGKKMFVVSMDNFVYPCPFLMGPSWKMGHFNKDRIHIDKEMRDEEINCRALQISPA